MSRKSESVLVAHAPHLEAVCEEIRQLPVTGFPGIPAVWIAEQPLHLPKEWLAFDGSGELAQNIVRDAWRQFWTKPFRVSETRDARHLVCWHALRFVIGGSGADASPTGVLMRREDTLGRQIVEPMHNTLPALFAGLLGSRSRSLLEAGMRRCLRTQLHQRGLPLDVPRAFLDTLGFRIEAQLDARMNWPQASRELLMLALGSETLVDLLNDIAPPRCQGVRWQRHLLALRHVAAEWPPQDACWLPLAVPMHQQGGGVARGAREVAVWLRSLGYSRQSLARLQRLSPSVTATLTSQMLDVRPAALRVHAAAANRFLALLAGCITGAGQENLYMPGTGDVIRALDWLAVDATHAMRSLPGNFAAFLTVCGTSRSDTHLPWLLSGKLENAEQRGLRPELTQDPERKLRKAYGQRNAQLPLDGIADEPVVMLACAEHVYLAAFTVPELVQARAVGDAREVRRLCALAMGEIFSGRYLHAGFESEIQDVCDWFMRAQPPPGVAQLRSWPAVRRRVALWHVEVVHPRALEDAIESWPDHLPDEWTEWVAPTDVGRWRAVQIADRHALCEEGVTLHHCVATYAVECVRASSVIFSIRHRDEDTRYGTAQFRHNGQCWDLVQFRGLRNLVLPAADTPEPEALNELLSRLAAKLDQVDFREARRA